MHTTRTGDAAQAPTTDQRAHAAPLVSATELTVTYRGSSTPALDAVDLAIDDREAVGIVGESGSGKTTLGKALVGLQEPTTGVVTVAGRRWSSVKRNDPLRRRVQMIFQDPIASLNPRKSALDTVAEVFKVWKRGTVDDAATLLERVGISRRDATRRPAQLSGGQCQRVSIARALACGPDVLVADEPTSSLDVSVQAQILNLIDELRAERGFAFVLISHDLSVIAHATTRCVVMHTGRIVEIGPTGTILRSPTDSYTRRLLESVPRLPPASSTVPRWASTTEKDG